MRKRELKYCSHEGAMTFSLGKAIKGERNKNPKRKIGGNKEKRLKGIRENPGHITGVNGLFSYIWQR